MFSKWVEVFLTSNQDAGAIAKALVTKTIPRWGIPEKISSEIRILFVNQVLKQVGETSEDNIVHIIQLVEMW